VPVDPPAPPPFPPYLPVAPPFPAPAPRRTGLVLRVALGLLLVAALCCGLGDTVLFVGGGNGRVTATFADDEVALTGLLQRRAEAVNKHDEAAFLADVDQSDQHFVERQRTEYQNLVALGLSSFTLTLSRPNGYAVDDQSLVRRYGGWLREVGVTVRYQVAGLDTVEDAEPWVPIFAMTGGHWLLAGEESAGGSRPLGTGGQPWEARPVTVVKSAHVVAVISKEDADIAPHLLDLAERGVNNVMTVRPGNWPGKLLVVAVTDQKVFDSYFDSSPDKLAQVEAVTIPRYNFVPEWQDTARFTVSRVVFNPAMLGRADDELQHTLTHEFTHVAFGPVTSGSTPNWLVEGMAEYVAYATEKVPAYFPGAAARHVASATTLPDDGSFYDSADNYILGWLAVKLIAEKYGRDKAVALYEWFTSHSDEDAGFRAVLGTSREQFIQDWLDYQKKLRST
jgi:hypothetical protein